MLARAAFIALFALSLTGCFSAPDACRDLAQTLCDRMVSCEVLDGSANCAQIAADLEACERVVGVSTSYDQCLSETSNFECTALQAGATAPDSCQGALAVTGDTTGPRRELIIGVDLVIRTSTTP